METGDEATFKSGFQIRISNPDFKGPCFRSNHSGHSLLLSAKRLHLPLTGEGAIAAAEYFKANGGARQATYGYVFNRKFIRAAGRVRKRTRRYW